MLKLVLKVKSVKIVAVLTKHICQNALMIFVLMLQPLVISLLSHMIHDESLVLPCNIIGVILS